MKISDFSVAKELNKENLEYIHDGAPGAYLLGKIVDGEFVVEYWGNAYFRNGVKNRLSSHIGNYDMFRVKVTITDSSAWKYECLAFHTYGTKDTDNEKHPKRPEGQTIDSLKCPFEGCML